MPNVDWTGGEGGITWFGQDADLATAQAEADGSSGSLGVWDMNYPAGRIRYEYFDGVDYFARATWRSNTLACVIATDATGIARRAEAYVLVRDPHPPYLIGSSSNRYESEGEAWPTNRYAWIGQDAASTNTVRILPLEVPTNLPPFAWPSDPTTNGNSYAGRVYGNAGGGGAIGVVRWAAVWTN
jgi:hypothetical protein